MQNEHAMCAHRRGFVVSSLVISAGTAICCMNSGALAQISWLGGSGNWSDSSKWAGSNIPNTSGESASIDAAGTYTVTQDGNFGISSLLIPTATATLNINNGNFLQLSSGGTSIANNGLINLNGTSGAAATYIQFLTSSTLSGSGILSLNANSGGNLDTAYLYFNGGNELLTQAAGHTIRGTGRVYINLDNSGTVDANVSGKSLLLSNGPKTNRNLMRATGGGFLDLSAAINQVGAGALISADGGTVRTSGAAVNGGALQGINSGVIEVSGNSTFNGVTTSGAAQVDNGVALSFNSGLTNNGTITVNSTAGTSGAYMLVLASQTVAGGGKIVLNANAGGNLDTAYIYYNGGNEVLTQASTHAIRGTGRIYVNLLNNGLVAADQSGKTLQLLSQPKTNNNLFEAINGGILSVNCSVTQSGGSIVSTASSPVMYGGATVSGGQVFASGAGGVSQITSASRFNGVTVGGPLEVSNNSSLQIDAGLVDNGIITVNPTSGASGALMQFLTSQTLSGTGQIVLDATAGNLDTSYLHFNGGNEVVTQASPHLIHGTGNIYVNILNNSTISADRAGRTLTLLGQPKTNTNLLTATNGGTLNISGISVTQSGANPRIVADAGSVVFTNAIINGGLVSSVNGGSGAIGGTSRFNSVTSSTTLSVPNNTALQINGGLVNNGVVTINPSAGANDTYLQALTSQTLSGTGEIVLNASATNLDTAYLLYNGGNEVLTHSAPHLIHGTGSIYVNLTNNSTINADRAGRILSLVGQPKTNTNLLTATNGGTLNLASTMTQSGANARIVGDAGSLIFSTMRLNGGLVTTSNAGTAAVAGTSMFVGVVNSSPAFSIPDATALLLDGGLTNNGTITINPSAGTGGTKIQAQTSQMLSGTGQVVLNANPSNLDTAYIYYNGGNEVLTQAAAHTIRGTGNIYVNLANNGLVEADQSGVPLRLVGIGKSNNAIIRARNSAFLDVATNLSQSATGRLIADGGTTRFFGSTTSGGSIEAINGGTSQTSASTTFNGVTISGPFNILSGTFAYLTSSITNNGTITINSAAAAADTRLQTQTSVTIGGSGRVVLNANPANLDQGIIFYNGGNEVLTLGPDQTLAGRGNIYPNTHANGPIAPGTDSTPIGQLNLVGNANLTLSSTSVCDFQVGGSGDVNADRITGNKAIVLAGTLNVSEVNGFHAGSGDSWTIIHGSTVSGSFDGGVNFPAPNHGIAYKIVYLPQSVVIKILCYADLNDDGGVDGSDVQAFFALWEAGDYFADVNGDGGVDGADIGAFFELWEGGGC